MDEKQLQALPNLSSALNQQAKDFLDYLTHTPFADPQYCLWCGSNDFHSYPNHKRCHCRACKRTFGPLTNTPFSGFQQLETLPVYARHRLNGLRMKQAGERCGLAKNTLEKRENSLVEILGARWPELLPWWHGVRQLTPDGNPLPLRTTPFTSLEEARQHHNHEYIQCLECGKTFTQLGVHLMKAHEMTALSYREKWQIMKQVPLAGVGRCQRQREVLRKNIADGKIDQNEQIALMLEINRQNPRRKPFRTRMELAAFRQSTLEIRPWERSPAITIADADTKRRAVERVNNRKPGETIKSVANELGIRRGTLWSWRKQLASMSATAGPE